MAEINREDIHERLAEDGKIAIIWSVEDVMSCLDVPREEAWQVLQYCKRNHSAEHGITWGVLRNIHDYISRGDG